MILPTENKQEHVFHNNKSAYDVLKFCFNHDLYFSELCKLQWDRTKTEVHQTEIQFKWSAGSVHGVLKQVLRLFPPQTQDSKIRGYSMFKRWFSKSICLMLLLGIQAVSAQDKPAPDTASVEDELKNIAQLGPGVHKIVKDKKGRIVSCIVVGQARISTVLGKSKGIELARKKADLQCSAAFVKWLDEKVKVVESDTEEVTELIEGEEGGAEDKTKESGKSATKYSSMTERISNGLVRGLQVIYTETNSEEKTYTVVKGWNAKQATALKKVSKDLAADEPEDAESGRKSKENGGKKDQAEQADKQIKDRSNVASDADEFFPKRKK